MNYKLRVVASVSESKSVIVVAASASEPKMAPVIILPAVTSAILPVATSVSEWLNFHSLTLVATERTNLWSLANTISLA